MKNPKSYFKCCHFYWSIVLSNQVKLHRDGFLLGASRSAGAVCEQGEGSGQRTRRSKDLGSLTDHLKHPPEDKTDNIRDVENYTSEDMLPVILLGKKRG